MIKNLNTKSKFLALILRHKPEEIGLTLDQNGWADVNTLVNLSKITKDELDQIVSTDNKNRYEYNEDKTKIRARQGHSIGVDLGLEAKVPLDTLYHGTSSENYKMIQHTGGISRMSRDYVHLSKDFQTALTVGRRHSKDGYACVLEIMAKQMANEGHMFYLSSNGVWLTKEVPFEYVRAVTQEGRDVLATVYIKSINEDLAKEMGEKTLDKGGK